MTKLLKFEFRKLFRNKILYICFAISLAMVLITTLTYKALGDLLAQTAEETGTPIPVTNYTSLSLLKSSFSNGNVSLVGGVMIALLICEDYANDLTKNIYSKGFSREKLYFAKYISGLAAFLLLILIAMISSFAFGFALDGLGSTGENYVLSIICLLIIGIAYYTIFFGVSMLIKKIGGSIAINIIGPTVLSLLLVMGDTFLKVDNFSFADYWLDNNVSYLSQNDVSNKVIITSLVVSILVIAAMGAASFIVNSKKDN